GRSGLRAPGPEEFPITSRPAPRRRRQPARDARAATWLRRPLPMPIARPAIAAAIVASAAGVSVAVLEGLPRSDSRRGMQIAELEEILERPAETAREAAPTAAQQASGPEAAVAEAPAADV